MHKLVSLLLFVAACGGPTKLDLVTIGPDRTSLTASAICPTTGTSVISGGAGCVDPRGLLVASYPGEIGWTGSCLTASNGLVQAEAYAVCGSVHGEAVTTRTVKAMGFPAQCQTGEALVGGGCECPIGQFVVSSIRTQAGWNCECVPATGGATVPGTSYAICTSRSTYIFINPDWSNGCQPSEQLTGGGCGCTTSPLDSCEPRQDGTGWTAKCDDASNPTISDACQQLPG